MDVEKRKGGADSRQPRVGSSVPTNVPLSAIDSSPIAVDADRGTEMRGEASALAPAFPPAAALSESAAVSAAPSAVAAAPPAGGGGGGGTSVPEGTNGGRGGAGLVMIAYPT